MCINKQYEIMKIRNYAFLLFYFSRYGPEMKIVKKSNGNDVNLFLSSTTLPYRRSTAQELEMLYHGMTVLTK